MLEEDPSDDVFLQVGEELLRRARWAEAEDVLARGLSNHPDPEGFAWLARAALETGRFDLALSALERVDRSPATSPENARVEILVLERSGQLDGARERAAAFLAVDPADVVVQAVLERLAAPPPERGRRAADPFYTVDRAERYVAIGRPDRAIRVYRRILLAHPADRSIELRLRQLAFEELAGDDDLSEELTDPGLVPPEPIDMPAPTLGGTPAREYVPSANGPVPIRATEDAFDSAMLDTTEEEADDDTDLDQPPLASALDPSKARRRKRRSLIRK